jgi:hypothetical protein
VWGEAGAAPTVQHCAPVKTVDPVLVTCPLLAADIPQQPGDRDQVAHRDSDRLRHLLAHYDHARRDGTDHLRSAHSVTSGRRRFGDGRR